MSRPPGLYLHGDPMNDEYDDVAMRYLTMQRDMYDRWGVRPVVHISRRRKMLNFFKTLIDDLREFKRLMTLDSADQDGAAGHHGWDVKND